MHVFDIPDMFSPTEILHEAAAMPGAPHLLLLLPLQQPQHLLILAVQVPDPQQAYRRHLQVCWDSFHILIPFLFFFTTVDICSVLSGLIN